MREPAMKVIFLSDVHLKSMADPVFERCIAFLDRLKGRDMTLRDDHGEIMVTDRLVVAGDFFDFWFERGGVLYPDFRPVVERLLQMAKSGIRISLCEGNHDFFLADFFSRQHGIEVYPEDVELDLDGLRTYVSHGDTIDRENRRYLALRSFLRSPLSYRLQSILPLKFLWRLARFSSELSQGVSREKQQRLVDVMQRFSVEKFNRGLDAVILGHSHAALIQEERIDGKTKTFACLGDWIIHDSYLVYENRRFSLHRFFSGG